MKNNLLEKIKGATSFIVPAVAGGALSFRFILNYVSENYAPKECEGVYSILEKCSHAGGLCVFSALGSVAIGSVVGATSYIVYNFLRDRDERLEQESKQRLEQSKKSFWDEESFQK